MKKKLRGALVVASIWGFGAALVAQTPQESGAPSRPETYGGKAVSYLRVPGSEFFPGGTGVNFDTPSGVIRYSYNNTSIAIFGAPLHLPAGAKIVYLELDFLDGSSGAAEYARLKQCDLSNNCVQYPTAGAGPVDCLSPGFICSGNAATAGYSSQSADLTSENLIVNNVNYAYVLNAGNTSLDGTTELVGVLVGYVLQVSPGPGTATFTDVPTNHPFFKFVEALAAAGITSGYGDGRFGVNDPVTRGQMAVFLSVALGLQWP